MASQAIKGKDLAALDQALGEMVRSEPWQALAKERGWVEMYQPSAEFASFLKSEQPRIEGILKEFGLTQ